VQCSAEAVKASLEKLTNEEVRVRVIHSGVGGVNESDVMLAEASGAIIVGFNIRPDANAKASAEKANVDIRLYRVIYDCIEEIEAAMKGMLAPKFKEVVLGMAEVRQTIKVSGIGTVAGCYVKDGKMVRNASIRLIRDNVVIFEGQLGSLKRFKDDVKEVAENFECGMTIENYNDLKEGDVIEAFEMQEIKN
jgi:translation initiation factor IF-2